MAKLTKEDLEKQNEALQNELSGCHQQLQSQGAQLQQLQQQLQQSESLLMQQKSDSFDEIVARGKDIKALGEKIQIKDSYVVKFAELLQIPINSKAGIHYDDIEKKLAEAMQELHTLRSDSVVSDAPEIEAE